MTVTSNDLLVGPVTPSNGTTLISVDFYFEAAANLEVYKSGSETPLTLGVDYTVSLPTALNATDGSITLLTAANGTDVYSIFGIEALQRSSDIQFRGDLRSPVINVELDRIWRALQSIKTTAARTINLARTAPELPPITFTPGGTDGRAIVFNADSSALVPGATADEIAGAQAAATAAGNSADAAAASATAASGSATTASNAADTVAPILPITAEIQAIEAIDAEVVILAAIAADVTAVAAISTDVSALEAITADISLLAAIDDDVARVSDIYQGALAADPTTRLDGSALEVGDFYLNTGTGNLTFLQSTGPAVWVGVGALVKATQGEAEAGTDNDKYMTPLRTAQAILEKSAIKAWVNFNGTGTVAIRDSLNVSSITDVGVGEYTVNFISAMPDVNYAVLPSNNANTDTSSAARTFSMVRARATGSVKVQFIDNNGNGFDSDYVAVAVIH